MQGTTKTYDLSPLDAACDLLRQRTNDPVLRDLGAVLRRLTDDAKAGSHVSGADFATVITDAARRLVALRDLDDPANTGFFADNDDVLNLTDALSAALDAITHPTGRGDTAALRKAAADWAATPAPDFNALAALKEST
jgi:hypothetical protein